MFIELGSYCIQVVKMCDASLFSLGMKLQTMSVLAVMRNLRSEVDAGSIKPYCFVEINGLKLATAENIYRVRCRYVFGMK